MFFSFINYDCSEIEVNVIYNTYTKMKLLVLKFSLIVCVLSCSKAAIAQDEFDTIRRNIVAGLKNPSRGKEKTDMLIKRTQQPDGSWKDINYRDSAITHWLPIKHLQNIESYCLALNQSQNDLKERIVAGLRYWLLVTPASTNWWHNEIAVPQTMGRILLLLEDAEISYPRSLKDSLVSSMIKGNPYKQTGANKLDIAIHYLYRACVTKNSALMDSAVQQAFDPIRITTEAGGLQNDFSYLQHGRQLYISGYGTVFLMGAYKVATWVAGTGFALGKEKLNLLQTYLTKTYLKAIRGSYSDFNIEGRGVSRPNALNKKSGKQDGYADEGNTILEMAKKLNPSDTPEISNAIARIQGWKEAGYAVEPYHKFFYRADYTLHLRKDYSFNVRMVSERTVRTETGNGENLLGRFLPDGSTNIQQRGDEYYNIMPVWEWDKIPGITCRDFATDQPAVKQWGETGSTVFAGGVSDGRYGCTAYDMSYNKVSAKKSWFFFDKQVICLGAGISCNEDEAVTTTLNQCWQRGNTVVYNRKVNKIVKAVDTLVNPSLVWHDSIGYYFLGAHVVALSNGKQVGNWKKINNTYTANEIAGNVFKLSVLHGVKPHEASYSYGVVPAISLKEAKKYSLSGIKVLSNSKALQAVLNTQLQILQACFYVEGTVNYDGLSITVDKPCLLMVKNFSTANMEIWVAEPTQKIKEINVQVKQDNKIILQKATWNNEQELGSSVLAD